MTQGWGNYDTVRVEGWGFRRIEEGQQGVWGGAVACQRHAARRRGYGWGREWYGYVL